LESNGASGVTNNDPGDGDTGANALQNFPEMTSAASDGFVTTVEGALDSVANDVYRLEFFVSAECDPSGHGEGAQFFGGAEVQTNGAGEAVFSVALIGDVFDGEVVTATATRVSTGDTSEFSSCQPIDISADDTTPPFIVHGAAIGPITHPFSGYIDPRSESSDGLDADLGLTALTIVFSEPVVDIGGTALTTGAFSVRETGGGAAHILSVDVADDRVVTLTLDRPITLMEWTTIEAAVEDLVGNEIENLGDLGPGVVEPDRVDVAFLPADADQSGEVTPFDLLEFRQMVNGVVEPEAGVLRDYLDTDRSGSVTPFDLLVFRQLINGSGNATQAWSGATLNAQQP
jgi:hypothetical protein